MALEHPSADHQAQQHGVEHHPTEVAAPAQDLGYGQHAARCDHFPQGHGREDAQEEAQPDGWLMGQDELSKIQGGLQQPGDEASGQGMYP